jgi:hypothetical protein
MQWSEHWMTTPIPDGWHSVIHVKYWEIIADNLSKADWSWGCVSAADEAGSTGQRFHFGALVRFKF